MVSTMYNDVVTLLVEKTIRDEIGMKQTFYEEREVFAEELPINQSEFFKCRETGCALPCACGSHTANMNKKKSCGLGADCTACIVSETISTTQNYIARQGADCNER